jgi:LAS superfamily LD-carboxypeptidase LdcB
LPTSLVEGDPFPADFGVWTCESYLQVLEGTPQRATLDALLDVRPHVYRAPAAIDALIELDADLVLESRRQRPLYRHLVHRDVHDSLVGLLRAANASGLSLRVQSAYRSSAYQNLLWKLAVRQYQSDLGRAGFAVAPPCFSEHATGRTVDFASPAYPGRFVASPEYRWLQDHAHEWGWTQSFTPETGAVAKPGERGILVEPWHFHHASLHAGAQAPVEGG